MIDSPKVLSLVSGKEGFKPRSVEPACYTPGLCACTETETWKEEARMTHALSAPPRQNQHETSDSPARR